MNKDLVNLLQLGIVKIKFRKRDGSIRDMRATLVPDLIGVETYSKNAGPEHVQCVWDVDKDEWRSFRWDCLIEHQPEQSQRAA
jgi:hypothetical protein